MKLKITTVSVPYVRDVLWDGYLAEKWHLNVSVPYVRDVLWDTYKVEKRIFRRFQSLT